MERDRYHSHSILSVLDFLSNLKALSAMKYLISSFFAISLLSCGGLDVKQDYLISELHEVIERADQKLENPSTAQDWEPIEKEFQEISAEVREAYPGYEPPIQHRFDSLQNYFKAQRQAYLDKVSQIQAGAANPAENTPDSSQADSTQGDSM